MVLISLAVLLLVCGLSLSVDAQKKRKKKPTQPLPMPTPVQTVEPEVVSRASDEVDMGDYFPKASSTPATETQTNNTPALETSASSAMVEELARQVRELTSKINSMDAKQKMLLDLEILSRAEQRTESLRKQLMDSTDKEAAIKTRLTELEMEMKPETIERKAAFIGSLRPEEVRENMRKTLQMEKDRITTQLSQLQNNRATLETSLQNAEALVEKLRVKLEKEIDEQMQVTPAKKPE